MTLSIAELNSHAEWFVDPSRSPRDNAGPHLIVVDDFYADPIGVRALALSHRFEQWSPPSADQVGDELAAKYRRSKGTWMSTANVVFAGKRVRQPFYGWRHNPPEVARQLERVVGESIIAETWDTDGDYWNGAFQLTDGDYEVSAIHHHYKDGDVAQRGWSGVVYMTPDAPAELGTSIWRTKSTGQCIASHGGYFESDVSKFELAYLVENRFNRLVLFRENVLHRGERGFGTGHDARLVQTFFFRTTP
ncbi:MAG: hypothetical protein ABI867_14335 [Kofleriaceae bacterium]